MNRKIELLFEISDDKETLTVYITDESNNSITRYTNEYMFSEYDTPMGLYNHMLDVYDAEYDDEFANVLEQLANKLEKEGVFKND